VTEARDIHRRHTGFWWRGLPTAVGLVVFLISGLSLSLIGVSDEWLAGVTVVAGVVAMIVTARILGISASALWWWPLNDVTRNREDECIRPTESEDR
jgi:hypothetical protein